MRSRTRFMCRMALFSGMTLAAGGFSAASAQQPSPGTVQDQDDITRAELANFDRFLDSHPDVARQLAANPSLVTDPNFLQAQPALRDYLTQHPRVQTTITANPGEFMRRESRFEGSAADRDRNGGRDRDRDADRDRDRDARQGDADITRRVLGETDRLMDNHTQI
jgi:hypothetical protein